MWKRPADNVSGGALLEAGRPAGWLGLDDFFPPSEGVSFPAEVEEIEAQACLEKEQSGGVQHQGRGADQDHELEDAGIQLGHPLWLEFLDETYSPGPSRPNKGQSQQDEGPCKEFDHRRKSSFGLGARVRAVWVTERGI